MGVGYKVIGGRRTDRLAIRVYVEKKQDVPEAEAIPKMIRGVPTDVIERRFVLSAGQSGETEEEPQQLSQARKENEHEDRTRDQTD